MEFNADQYCVNKGYGVYLHSALIQGHIHNAGDMTPDWLFALMKYDHPIFVERLAAIEKRMEKIATTVIKSGPSPTNFKEIKMLYSQVFHKKLIENHPQAMYKEILKERREEDHA